jgi:CO/xanthine dehydrogenase FAD-binding subunit
MTSPMTGSRRLGETSFADAKIYFEKVVDHRTWDFPLVNVGSALKVTNGVIDAARVASSNISCTPRYIKVVDDVVKDSGQDDETAELAGKTGPTERVR